MPTAPPRACLVPSCGGYAEQHGRCAVHAAPVRQAIQEARRREPGRSLYFTQRWQRLRLAVLKHEPLCRRCAATGRPVPATDVDHIEPHKGDPQRFWSRQNLQPLCAPCHWTKTAEERALG